MASSARGGFACPHCGRTIQSLITHVAHGACSEVDDLPAWNATPPEYATLPALDDAPNDVDELRREADRRRADVRELADELEAAGELWT